MSGILKFEKMPITAEEPEIEILCSIYCDYSNDLETDEKFLTKEHLETIRLYIPNTERGFNKYFKNHHIASGCNFNWM